jgi:serine/threonine-protein phosphatase PP1 catalytic subunit
VPQKGGVCDLLWSDPSEDVSEKWISNNGRQCSFYFGITQAKAFLNRNSLKLIIRAHEVHPEGYKYQKYMNVPYTLTIFSAPNYAETHKNKGSIAVISVLSL